MLLLLLLLYCTVIIYFMDLLEAFSSVEKINIFSAARTSGVSFRIYFSYLRSIESDFERRKRENIQYLIFFFDLRNS